MQSFVVHFREFLGVYAEFVFGLPSLGFVDFLTMKQVVQGYIWSISKKCIDVRAASSMPVLLKPDTLYTKFFNSWCNKNLSMLSCRSEYSGVFKLFHLSRLWFLSICAVRNCPPPFLITDYACQNIFAYQIMDFWI